MNPSLSLAHLIMSVIDMDAAPESRQDINQVTNPRIPPYGSIEEYADQYDTPIQFNENEANSAILQDAIALQKRREQLRNLNSTNEIPQQHRSIYYDEYVTDIQVIEQELGTKYFRGKFRINKRNTLEAYVTPIIDPSGLSDILIYGRKARNRALDEDWVTVELVDSTRVFSERQEAYLKWKAAQNAKYNNQDNTDEEIPEKESDLDKRCGKVIHVVRKHIKTVILGHLTLIKPGIPVNSNYARWSVGDYIWFKPLHPHNPLVQIPREELPAEFIVRPNHFDKYIYSVVIENWDRDCEFPWGTIKKQLGDQTDISTQKACILETYRVIDQEFSQECLDSLPPNPFDIGNDERLERTDFTGRTVFTIDPATARDLDDAIHIRSIGTHKYELGVHIADVSHFVKPGTPLFDRVLESTTTVYLVDDVYPMLPRMLSEDLCSLNPHVERLTFSVCWEVDFDPESGESVKIGPPRFEKSFIRSQCKLSYECAQDVIDGKDVSYNDDLSEDVQQSIKLLHQITQLLRRKRLAKGALSLCNSKRMYLLDGGGSPIACQPYKIYESNQLIEELMILANIAAAELTYNCFPKNALVRRHVDPESDTLRSIQTRLDLVGVSLDVSSSLKLQLSLDAIENEMLKSLVHAHCVRAMYRAEYICTADIDDFSDMHHYGLATDLYTHFTSPIRRAADILVHRLLHAVITGVKEIDENEYLMPVSRIAETCTQAKLDADRAYDASSDLHLALFLKDRVPPNVTFQGHVVIIDKNGVQIVIPSLGFDQKAEFTSFCKDYKVNDAGNQVEFTWKKSRNRGYFHLLQPFFVTITPDFSGPTINLDMVPVEHCTEMYEPSDMSGQWTAPIDGTD